MQTYKILKPLFRKFVWNIPTSEKEVFLTFDDGPTPEVTEWVIDVLSKHKVPATFFCLGKNIEENPELFKRLADEGHLVANHSWDHPNGWKTIDPHYIDNVTKADIYFNNKLFRPPYGRITKSQTETLKEMGYELIMWSKLSKDYDQNLSPEQCFQNVVNDIEPGDIIVFHDSKKAFQNLKGSLNNTIESILEKGYSFKTIPYPLPSK